MLGVVPLLTVLDSIAAGVEVLLDANDTIESAALANVATLSAGDASVHTDVIPVFDYRATLLTPGAMAAALQGAMIQRALDRHYGATSGGDLNAFLRTNAERVHPNLKLIGMQIDSRNTFAPTVVDPAALYEGTGAGSGSLAAVIDIDASQYGDSAWEIVVDAMGGTDRDVRVTLRTFDNVDLTDDVTIPANAAPDTVIAIAGKGVGIASIDTISGGENGDAFHVRSVVERAIAL